jgi:hypothetical protein
MEYDVKVDKYELNMLIATVNLRLNMEKKKLNDFYKSDDLEAADLQSSIVANYAKLFNKLVDIKEK